MILIAMLISLAADKFFAPVRALRHLIWFLNFSRWLRNTFGNIGENRFGVLLCVGLPALAVALAYLLLVKTALLLIAFAFAVMVLIFALGPDNLDEQVDGYVSAKTSGDTQAMQRHGDALMHEDVQRSAVQPQRPIVESMLIQANERIFAVLFWFVALGPAGALLYRLSCILKVATSKERQHSRFAQAAKLLHSILDWLPARLTGLGYAIAGSLVDAFSNWQNSKANWSYNWQASNVGILLASGLGALKLDRDYGDETASSTTLSSTTQIKSAQSLIWRTLVGWIVIIALMTLAGWAS